MVSDLNLEILEEISNGLGEMPELELSAAEISPGNNDSVQLQIRWVEMCWASSVPTRTVRHQTRLRMDFDDRWRSQRAEEWVGVKSCNSNCRRLNTKHGSKGYSRTQENCKVFNKSFSGVVTQKLFTGQYKPPKRNYLWRWNGKRGSEKNKHERKRQVTDTDIDIGLVLGQIYKW